MATKKEILEHLQKIIEAFDYFRDRSSRFSFTPPEDKSWVELRTLVDEAKQLR